MEPWYYALIDWLEDQGYNSLDAETIANTILEEAIARQESL